MNNMSFFPIKDIPLKAWGGVLLVFAMITALFYWGQLQLGYAAINSDQFYYQVFIDRFSHPNWFALDSVFHTTKYFEFYTPTFLWAIKPLFKTLGFLSTLQTLMPILSMAYLVSCFIFLYKFTGNIFASALIAILSGQMTPIFPIETWGVFSIAAVMPRTIFLIAAPLFFYGWLAFQKNPYKLYGLFFLIGLCANFHPVSGLTLTLPMIIAQLIESIRAPLEDRLKQVKITILCGLAALIPMLPFAMTYFNGTHIDATSIPPGNIKTILEGLTYRIPVISLKMWSTYSSILYASIGWWLLALWCSYQLKHKLPALMLWFVLSCLTIFVSYYWASFDVLAPAGIPPLLIDLVRITKFIMLPTLLVIALWLSSALTAPQYLIKVIIIVLLTTMLNENLLIQEWATVSTKRKPAEWLKATGQHIEHQIKWMLVKNGWLVKSYTLEEIKYFNRLNELALWFKQNTPPANTKIHVGFPFRKSDAMMIRTLSQRSITFSKKDGGFLYYSSKPQFLTWYKTALLLDKLHQNQGYCSDDEILFAKNAQASHIICPVTSPNTNRLTFPVSYKDNQFIIYQLATSPQD